MDVRRHNRAFWDKMVEAGDRWTVPVSGEIIAAARRGDWRIFLTPTKPVPGEWFPRLEGLEVLCLASGGGQQGPTLAAAGARVTVFDSSPNQLSQDRFVAERDSLEITTVEGDMADLSAFVDGGFGLIVHPVANCFAADIRPIWKETFRVLRRGGVLIAGFNNPAVYLFDYELAERDGILQVKYRLPYSDLTSPDEDTRHRDLVEKGEPIEFSHSIEDQIGGQLDAGFVLTGLYEDRYPEGPIDEDDLLTEYMDVFIATRAVKP